MLTAAELASMQATAEASLDQTAAVERNTPASDAFGHQTASWATVATGVAVRIASPGTPQYAQIAAQLGVVAAWKVSFAVSADVRAGDRLIVGSDTFHVHMIASPQSYNTLNEAICTEVK